MEIESISHEDIVPIAKQLQRFIKPLLSRCDITITNQRIIVNQKKSLEENVSKNFTSFDLNICAYKQPQFSCSAFFDIQGDIVPAPKIFAYKYVPGLCDIPELDRWDMNNDKSLLNVTLCIKRIWNSSLWKSIVLLVEDDKDVLDVTDDSFFEKIECVLDADKEEICVRMPIISDLNCSSYENDLNGIFTCVVIKFSNKKISQIKPTLDYVDSTKSDIARHLAISNCINSRTLEAYFSEVSKSIMLQFSTVVDSLRERENFINKFKSIFHRYILDYDYIEFNFISLYVQIEDTCGKNLEKRIFSLIVNDSFPMVEPVICAIDVEKYKMYRLTNKGNWLAFMSEKAMRPRSMKVSDTFYENMAIKIFQFIFEIASGANLQ